MPANFLQDSQGNDSSMRLVFLLYILAVIVLTGLIVALIMHNYFADGEKISELGNILKYLTGGGAAGFFAKLFQKKYEEAPVKQIKEPEEEKQPEEEPDIDYSDWAIVVDRIYENEHKTLSQCGVWDGQKYVYWFKGIELPWRNNSVNISRIPAGTYPAKAILKGRSNYYGIHILNVPNRTEIMIHIANYVRELRGCLACGVKFADIDRDGIIDVKKSKIAIDGIAEFLPLWSKFKVIIRDKFDEYNNERPEI